MRLASGRKIGQSRYELAISVFFSLFLHLAVIALALIIRMATTTRVNVPPSYSVKLVGLPQDLAQPAAEAPAQSEKPGAKLPLPKVKKAESRPAKPAAHKGAIPELAPKQAKPAPGMQEQTEPAPTPAAKETGTPGKAQGTSEGVAVSAGSSDPALATYLGAVRNKIARNWNPPPGAAGLKAKVKFTINRSGVILDHPALVEQSGNFYFDQAAIRAIQQSSPFPPMPEESYRPTAEFTVDLTPVD